MAYCKQCGHDTLMQQEQDETLYLCGFCGHKEHRCPKCGSENIVFVDIDCSPDAYYRDVPTCEDCGHHLPYDRCPKCGLVNDETLRFHLAQKALDSYWSRACAECSNNIKPDRMKMCEECVMVAGGNPTSWIKRIRRPVWNPRKIRC